MKTTKLSSSLKLFPILCVDAQGEFRPSHAIQLIGYDDASQRLQVVFQSGHCYDYFDVPDQIFYQFLQSPSKGQFLNRCIRKHYRYQKIAVPLLPPQA